MNIAHLTGKGCIRREANFKQGNQELSLIRWVTCTFEIRKKHSGKTIVSDKNGLRIMISMGIKTLAKSKYSTWE
jgi:hypothetical protein